jgi:hypothetical protein
MEMADKNPVDAGRRNVCKDELPLRPLSGVEEEALAVPKN